MVQKKKKKKYKLNARFYVWLMSLGIISCTTFQMVTPFQNNAVPNFHGWSAEKVMTYDAAHKEIAITYELVYSYDVLHNRVLSQSVKPSTKYKKEPIQVHLQVSKGYPVMADFTGKSLDDLLAFAKAYDIKVTQHASATPILNQTFQEDENPVDETLSQELRDEAGMDENPSSADEQLADDKTTDNNDAFDESISDEMDSSTESDKLVEENPEGAQKQRKVMTQSIPAGSTLLKGSEIEITFGIE